MNQIDQIAMFPPAPESESRLKRAGAALWFGLAVDHWQLFEALQDEWLRPPSGGTGRVLGVRAFTGKATLPSTGNRSIMHLKLDPARLPRINVLVRRGGQWLLSPLDGIRAEDDDAIFWSGPLPTSAISEILVSTNDERIQLAGLTRQVSNVALPTALGLLSKDFKWVAEEAPTHELPPGLELPSDLDAVHGALAMAVWAVPRIDPWLDLLTATLGPSTTTDVLKLAKVVAAPWWAHPPWVAVPDAAWPANLEERLWLAATGVLRERPPGQALAAVDITRKIAAMAAGGDSIADEIALSRWVDETQRILHADTTIHLDDWTITPVGKAIQLVLARPIPTSFRTWIEDLPDLPPTIWWSAATLCGLLHGYRRLDGHFRGGATQSRLLAIHAQRISDSPKSEVVWPGTPTDAPAWRRESEKTILSWGGEDFSGKAETLRGRWYVADMTDPDVGRAAEAMARRNGWMERNLVLSAPLQEPGDALQIRLPRSAKIEEVFDPDTFRHCIATERFIVPGPPPSRRSVVQPRQTDASGLVSGSDFLGSREKTGRLVAATDASAENGRRSVHRDQIEIPGFFSIPDFLNETEEAELVSIINTSEWQLDLKRRVQHYGWRYNYKSRRIDVSMRLGPLPSWAAKLAERLAERAILPHVADQVIVNEYIRDQGISKHKDCIPCFADGIAMISLLESWEMVFRNEGLKTSRILEQRSVAVMTGDARYRWTHEIPSRLSEPREFQRQRRISITFRKVNVASQ